MAKLRYERINGASREDSFMDKVVITMENDSPEELIEITSCFMSVCLGERSSFYASEAEDWAEKETE